MDNKLRHVQIYRCLPVHGFGELVNVTIGMNESTQVYRPPGEMCVDKEGDQKKKSMKSRHKNLEG